MEHTAWSENSIAAGGIAAWLDREIEPGERIIPHAIETRLARTSSDALTAWAEGSTKAVVVRVHHAGIAPTRRWQFLMDRSS